MTIWQWAICGMLFDLYCRRIASPFDREEWTCLPKRERWLNAVEAIVSGLLIGPAFGAFVGWLWNL